MDESANSAASPPLVTFYRFIPDCRMPQRADSSAAGSMPTRAFRYCEAMTHGVRVRLVPVPADGVQPHVGRRHRHHVDLRGRRRLVSAQDARRFPTSPTNSTRRAPDESRAIRRRSSARRRSRAWCRSGPASWRAPRPVGACWCAPPANLPRKLGLRGLRGHRRDRPLVRPAVRQPAPDPHQRADRVRRRVAAAAGPAGAPRALRQCARRVRDSSPTSTQLRPEEWNAFRKTVVRPKHGPAAPAGRIRGRARASGASRSFLPDVPAKRYRCERQFRSIDRRETVNVKLPGSGVS